MSDVTNLFDENLAFFEVNNPPLFERLTAYEPMGSLILDDKDGPDLSFEGMNLYGMGANKHAELQAKKYWQNPERAMVNPLSSSSVDAEAGVVLYDMMKFAEKNDITFNLVRTTDTVFHLVILGIGLGQHIEPLLEKTMPRSVLFIEPNFEFLYQSMFTFDWKTVLGRILEGGCKVNMLTDNKSDVLIPELRRLYTEYGQSCFDGLTVYKHYNNPAFDGVMKFLVEEGAMLYSGLGYFEDELNMIANTYNNLKDGTEKVFYGNLEQKDFPVFVVGSGPSLDGAIDVIKANMHKAVIVSCGTALLPLLSKGIRPDFHVELERSKFQMEIPEAVSKDFDISDVWLVGSSTLIPGVKKVFDKRIFYFRNMLSSFPAFSGHVNNCLHFPSPTVGNAGTCFAQDSGFKKIYMFGIDLGFVDTNTHHAADSIYLKKGGGYEVPTVESDRSMRGNFGGSVRSTYVLQWSRDTLQISMMHASMGHIYYNCSDGAFIEGTIPLLPEFVDLPEPPEPKSIFVERMANAFPDYTKQDFDDHWQDGDLIKKVRAFGDRLIACIRENPNLGTKKYITALMDVANPIKFDDAAMLILRGSLFQLLLIGEYYLDRIEQADKKDDLTAFLCDAYCEAIDKMCDEVDVEFTALQETGALKNRETVWD